MYVTEATVLHHQCKAISQNKFFTEHYADSNDLK